MRSTTTRPPRKKGFSLPEILVSIAIVGILAGLALSVFTGVSDTSQREAGSAYVETLNRAVMAYNQCGSTISIVANGASAADEQSVIALLTTEDPAIPGTPYLAGNVPATASDDTAVMRVRWDGRYFELLAKGAAGSGLKLNL